MSFSRDSTKPGYLPDVSTAQKWIDENRYAFEHSLQDVAWIDVDHKNYHTDIIALNEEFRGFIFTQKQLADLWAIFPNSYWNPRELLQVLQCLKFIFCMNHTFPKFEIEIIHSIFSLEIKPTIEPLLRIGSSIEWYHIRKSQEIEYLSNWYDFFVYKDGDTEIERLTFLDGLDIEEYRFAWRWQGPNESIPWSDWKIRESTELP